MIPHPYDAYLLFALLLLLFAAFVRERWPNELAAGLVVALLLAVGILTPTDALSALSSEAPITVGLMFVMSAALDRTGAIQNAGTFVVRLARTSPSLGLVLLMLGALVSSAFINNTPVVVILTPIAVMLASVTHTPASKFLIPLSYSAILGGTCTLIGTSTNLIVAGVARESGAVSLSLFDITPLGLIYGAIGLTYMAIMAPRLLPRREIFTQIFDGGSLQPQRQFLADLLVPHGSPLIGKQPDQMQILSKIDARLVDVIRNRKSIYQEEYRRDLTIEAGDRLILRSSASDLLDLRSKSDLVFSADAAQAETLVKAEHVLEPISAQNTQIFECIIGPGSPFAGKRIGTLNLRRNYGIYVLAIHRHGESIGPQLDRLKLEFGDTLLLEGPPDAVKQLVDMDAVIPLAPRERQSLRSNRQGVAILIFCLLIGLTSFGVMPFVAAAMVSVVLVIATGCLTLEEAYKSISWPILMLIFSMLAIGGALETTGASELIVQFLLFLSRDQTPVVVLSLFYFFTMALTEFVSNNATAVVLTPIAIALAGSMGLNPEPFVIAVMFAASASFATPIGYQTNTFVYSAGGYRFTDFVRIGLPLNLILWSAATFLIPQFFPLQGP